MDLAFNYCIPFSLVWGEISWFWFLFQGLVAICMPLFWGSICLPLSVIVLFHLVAMTKLGSVQGFGLRDDFWWMLETIWCTGVWTCKANILPFFLYLALFLFYPALLNYLFNFHGKQYRDFSKILKIAHDPFYLIQHIHNPAYSNSKHSFEKITHNLCSCNIQ